MHENEISGIILDSAMKVHRILGPGLLESVYEAVLAHELASRNLRVQRQVPVRVVYEGVEISEGFRADMIVEAKVIIELKSIEQVAPVHQKQLLTYLRLCDLHLGLLINFNVYLLKDGFHRVVDKLI
jgi:GxxExxY protein